MSGGADSETTRIGKDLPQPARQSSPTVLFVTHAGEVAGAELCLFDVATASSPPSTVLLLSDGPFRPQLEKAGVRVEVLAAPKAFHRVRRETRLPSVSALLSIPAIVLKLAARARSFDLVYANSQKAFLVASMAARLARRPLIWHLHDILSPEHFSRTNIRLDVALANSLAHRVITVSNAAATAFVQGGGQSAKITVVHNGIDAGPFLKVDQVNASQEIRSRLGIGQEPLVGCFSRLAPWKGQHVVIEALAELKGVHAVLVGGELFSGACHEDTLRQLAQTLGVAERVHFVGHQDDIPRLMQGVDIIVHPSTAPEPFARVVIESLLSARPLVAAANGGTPEIVEDGENGLLFVPKDSADLARSILRLINEPEAAASMAKRARSGAISDFSREAFVNGIFTEISNTANA